MHLLLLALLGLGLSCASGSAETGTVSFSIGSSDLLTSSQGAGPSALASSLSPLAISFQDVTRVRIDVFVREANGGTSPLFSDVNLAKGSDGLWTTGRLPFLPKNKPLSFVAIASNTSGDELFRGSTHQTLTENDTPVSIFLAPATHGADITLPRVQRITLPAAELFPSQSFPLGFLVEARAGERLDYVIEGAGGTFFPSQGNLTLQGTSATFVIRYTAPEVASSTNFTHALRLTNRDGHSVSTTFRIRVRPPSSEDQFPDNPTADNGFKSLLAGESHTCVLLSDGASRCWGLNAQGQLGQGHTRPMGDDELPSGDVDVGGGTVRHLVAGAWHTCALLDTGNVRCWGHNGYGQLGYNLATNQNVGDDEPAYWFKDVDLGDGVLVKDIVAGGNHTCAITTNNKVRCWGYNYHGQLGLGTNTNVGDDEKPSAVAEVNLGGGIPLQLSLGGNHPCALLDNGFLRCWGLNSSGQLGYGNTSGRSTPGSDLAPGGKVLQVTTGSDHTCALLSTGNIKCWGYNGYAQLGYGNRTNLHAPSTDLDLSGATSYRVSAGLYHTCALLSTGAARCWGRNQGGQLGYSSTTTDLPAPSVGDIKVLSPTGTITAGEAP